MMLAAFSVSILAGLGLIAVGVRELHRRRLADAVWLARWDDGWRVLPAGTMALIAGPVAVPVIAVDPTADVLAHVAPGPGSLTTLAEVGQGSLITITHADLVDPEVAAWFVDVFDRPAHTPARDEAREVDDGGVLTRFHIALEPAMRTARLWSMRGHAGHGPTASRWADLDRWRIDCPTGEYPSLLADPDYAAADMAEALLVS